MRSKAWLATRVSLRLAHQPRTASGAQCSRRLRSTRAAAPVLLAHADVTKQHYIFPMGPTLRYPTVLSAILWRFASLTRVSQGTSTYVFTSLCHFSSDAVTSACAKPPGAAAHVRRDGDVRAAHCLQCEAAELAGVTCALQARSLSACATHCAIR